MPRGCVCECVREGVRRGREESWCGGQHGVKLVQAEWTKREVLSLSRAGRAGEEKRSSYWWLSRRWALGFAELSSLLASCLELRGAIYFQQRLAGGPRQAPRPRASGGDPRADPSSYDAPPALATAPPGLSLGGPGLALADSKPRWPGQPCTVAVPCGLNASSLSATVLSRGSCGCPMTSTLKNHCPLESGRKFICFEGKF